MAPMGPIAGGSGDNRRALRKPVRLKAQLRDRGTAKFEIDVIDLSTTGFRAETSFTLWEGPIVWLTLPGLASLEATVAWRDGLLDRKSTRLNSSHQCAYSMPSSA